MTQHQCILFALKAVMLNIIVSTLKGLDSKASQHRLFPGSEQLGALISLNRIATKRATERAVWTPLRSRAHTLLKCT